MLRRLVIRRLTTAKIPRRQFSSSTAENTANAEAGSWSRFPVSAAVWESLAEQRRYLRWVAAHHLGLSELRDWYSVKPDAFKRIMNGKLPNYSRKTPRSKSKVSKIFCFLFLSLTMVCFHLTSQFRKSILLLCDELTFSL